MSHQKLQQQYEKIYSFFRTTTEPYDYLEWDGKTLEVWEKDQVIEKYSIDDLETIHCLDNH